ncbi:MAG TPA: hypothetical protein VF418_13950 [Sphingomonadaceae bacterium]
MTILEKFVAFAEGLPPEQLRLVEEVLEGLMEEGVEGDFTPEQLAELDRRLADPNPRYANPEDVEAIFRRHGVG